VAYIQLGNSEHPDEVKTSLFTQVSGPQASFRPVGNGLQYRTDHSLDEFRPAGTNRHLIFLTAHLLRNCLLPLVTQGIARFERGDYGNQMGHVLHNYRVSDKRNNGPFHANKTGDVNRVCLHRLFHRGVYETKTSSQSDRRDAGLSDP
jgi:hypothetical protein